MATVRLAPVLRTFVGGSKQVSAEGNNLAEVLNDLFERFPALKEQIQPEGNLSRFINIYVNDQDVRYLQGLETNCWSCQIPSFCCLPWQAGTTSTGKNYAL